jgi:hypothetical protein
MTPTNWIREYDNEKEKEFSKLFDSNGDLMFNDIGLFDTYVEKIPIWIKRKSIFYDIFHCEHLKIVHLLEPMHICKNISSSLWSHMSLKEATHWLLGEILFLGILKKRHCPRKEVEERIVCLGFLKKVMSHGF